MVIFAAEFFLTELTAFESLLELKEGVLFGNNIFWYIWTYPIKLKDKVVTNVTQKELF